MRKTPPVELLYGALHDYPNNKKYHYVLLGTLTDGIFLGDGRSNYDALSNAMIVAQNIQIELSNLFDIEKKKRLERELKKQKKVKIKGMGNVYRCKVCGQFPVWGAAFLYCENDCNDGYETNYNDPPGRAVREWNKENAPKKDKK